MCAIPPQNVGCGRQPFFRPASGPRSTAGEEFEEFKGFKGFKGFKEFGDQGEQILCRQGRWFEIAVPSSAALR